MTEVDLQRLIDLTEPEIIVIPFGSDLDNFGAAFGGSITE